MSIDYDHFIEPATLFGPSAALPQIFPKALPASLLDVGCGTGTWLRAAQDMGVGDIFGVDGITVPSDQLFISPSVFRQQNLTLPWELGRKFDAAICLEVAEHLDAAYAPVLIDALVEHSDLIVFAAASPDQPGQHHVNCQWPIYWQNLFNQRGYVCSDDVRWKIWNDARIEPWYRQNMMIATRDPDRAGKEARIAAVLHPAIYQIILQVNRADFTELVDRVESELPLNKYFYLLFHTLFFKLQSFVKKSFHRS